MNPLNLTERIHRAGRGDPEAADRLFAATYGELSRLARARLCGGRRDTLLDTSAVVHESYLRFVGAGSLQLADRVHFMWMDRAIASADLTDPSSAPGVRGMRAQRAHALFRLGRRDEALAEVSKVIDSLLAMPSTYTDWPLALSRVVLGRILIDSGRLRDAQSTLAAAMGYFDASEPADPYRAEASCGLAQARLLQRGQPEDWDRLDECLPVYRAWGLAEREVVESLERLALTRPR